MKFTMDTSRDDPRWAVEGSYSEVAAIGVMIAGSVLKYMAKAKPRTESLVVVVDDAIRRLSVRRG